MPELEDDIVVTIPDDSVAIPGAENAEAKEPAAPKVKDDPKVGWRASPVARRQSEDPEAKKIAALERERDEHARIAEEARQRAAQLDADRKVAEEARARAEELAAKREQEAMGAHWHRLQSDKTQLEVAITSAEEREQSARQRYIAAREAGNAEAEADALGAISEAKTAKAQLEQGKIAAERQIEETRRAYEAKRQEKPEPKAEPERRTEQPPPPKPQTPDDWINATVRPVLGDDGAAWLSENKQFVTDQRQNRLFLAFADLYAAEHGQGALKSQDFIDALNDKFFPDRDDGEEREEREERRQSDPEPEPERPQRRVASSAPVSRRGDQFFSSRNLNAGQVRLPPKLAARVKAMGMDPTQYAIQAVADIKAGLLPKQFLDPDYDHGV